MSTGYHAVCHLLEIKGFAIEKQFRIELSRAPIIQNVSHVHLSYGWLSCGQEIDKRAQIGGESDNSADVQIAVRPAIQAMSNAIMPAQSAG